MMKHTALRNGTYLSYNLLILSQTSQGEMLVSENKDSRVEGLSFYSTIFGVKKPLLW